MTTQELMRFIRDDNGDTPIWRAWIEATSGGEADAFRASLMAMNFTVKQDGGDQIVLVTFSPVDVLTIVETAIEMKVTYCKPKPRI